MYSWVFVEVLKSLAASEIIAMYNPKYYPALPERPEPLYLTLSPLGPEALLEVLGFGMFRIRHLSLF